MLITIKESQGGIFVIHIFIEIKAQNFDTLALWKRIKHIEKVNLTSTGERTWIHGDIHAYDLGFLVGQCSVYGELDITVARKGS